MKKKKLLFVMPFFFGIGGVEHIIQNRIIFLQNYFDILIFESNSQTTEKSNLSLDCEIFSINYKKNSFFPLFNYIKIFRKLLNQFQPDEVIVLDNGWKGLLIPYFSKNIKTSYERHGAIHFDNNDYGVTHALKKFIFQTLAQKYKRIFFLNDGMAAHWNHPNKLVMPNGIIPNEKELINEPPSSVLWVGRQSPEKGLDTLFKIWDKVSTANPNWTLKIFTPEPLNPKLFQSLNKIENIFGLTNKSSIYKSGSILVNTSKYEGFGLTILEGMNFGLPVMAFDVADGPKYLIENHVNGYLIEKNNVDDFAKKLNILMHDGHLRKVFGEKSLQKSLPFDLNKIHQKWLDIYNT